MRQVARFALSVTLPDCLSLLAKVGERWHEASLCADYLRPVVDEVAKAFHDRIMSDEVVEVRVGREKFMTERLRGLLFPDGPLAWNARTNADGMEGEGVGKGIEGVTPLPELPDLQWNGNWDLDDLLFASGVGME